MSSATPQAPRDLEDFVELLRALDDAGLDFAVIGGCAVGAYARLRGTKVIAAGSADERAELETIVARRTFEPAP